jgi:hypothetical protein
MPKNRIDYSNYVMDMSAIERNKGMVLDETRCICSTSDGFKLVTYPRVSPQSTGDSIIGKTVLYIGTLESILNHLIEECLHTRLLEHKEDTDSIKSPNFMKVLSGSTDTWIEDIQDLYTKILNLKRYL